MIRSSSTMGGLTLAEPPDPLSAGVLHYTRCPVPTATGLAVGLGTLAPALREKHGVRLRALQDLADPAMRSRHFDHGLPELIREGGNIPALWARSSGAPTRLLGITWLDEYQAIVTSSASQIADVGDLVGRRVAVPLSVGATVDFPRASALRGLQQALRTAGLGLQSVRIVDVPREAPSGPAADGRGEHFDAELDLLSAGAADAVWCKGAGGVAAVRERGLRQVMRIDLHRDPLVRVNNGTPRPITARQELIDARPELVSDYLRALAAAQSAIGADRRRLWRVLSRETHQSVHDAEAAYGQIEPRSLLPSLAPSRLRALQHQADFLFEHGFMPNRVDVEAWAIDEFDLDDHEPAGAARVREGVSVDV